MADTIKLEPIRVRTIQVSIRGLTPLISHQFDQKARKMIRDKKLGQKVKQRQVADPEAEFDAGTYVLSDGSWGVPATALKNAIAGAAHKDLGLPKTVLRKGLFIVADDTPAGGIPLVRLNAPERIMREDTVRVGMGSTDLRWRPEFPKWEIDLRIKYDEEWLQPETIIGLLQRAGFGVGIGEWRPERDGDFGRFEVITTTEEV